MARYNPKFEQIIYERKGDHNEVLWLTMNNPEMMNALTNTMQLELIEALENTLADNSIRCVILTGAGDKSFSAGGDISLINSQNNLESYEYLYHRGNHVQRLLTYMDKPVIAAVNGYCFAGALELALCSDFIYASENASFGLTEINLGILPGWGGSVRLPQKIGVNRAKEMIYRAKKINAEEAYRWGLVNIVVPIDQLYQEVEKAVKDIISKPPLAVRAAKTLINDAMTCDSIQAAQTMERGMNMWLVNTEDFKEGTSSFLEKRKAIFNGR